jgi:hypothetical protein
VCSSDLSMFVPCSNSNSYDSNAHHWARTMPFAGVDAKH